MKNLPDSNDPDLRDYLYIDRQRVGSLLAQFANGLPAERSESNTRSSQLRLAIQQAFSLERGIDRSDSQTLALADLHVSQLEEDAEALGLLGDVSEQVQKRKFWLRGKIRQSLQPGMLLRVTASTQISDVSSILDSFYSLSDAFHDADEEFTPIIAQIQALYGDSITVSIRTGEIDDFQIGFVGEIPHQHNFGPMRRELLLSQIGPEATELTTLMQIAAVPTDKDSGRSPEQLLADLSPQFNELMSGGVLDRRILDQFLAALGGILANSGFIAAPRWPAISIIPLAIYRSIDRVPDLSLHLDDE